MKKLIRLNLVVVGVLALTQFAHATTVRAPEVTVGGDTTYSTSQGIVSKVAVVTPASSASSEVAAKATTLTKGTAPVLSSLSTRSTDLPSVLTDARNIYTPESLVENLGPRNPTGTKSGSSSGSSTPKTPAPVPDGGATIGLLGMGLLGTVVMKRRLNP